MVQFELRTTPLRYSKAAMLKNAIEKKDTVYSGRGAYTGLVDNPVDANTTLYPTFRVNRDSYAAWAGIDGVEYWGLIGGNGAIAPNLKPLNEGGMGQIPEKNPDTGQDVDPKQTKVGYVHGMCSAIVECVSTGAHSTPYEMATGNKTTKMASCFPCSTYMYSTGYPPNSIHLGRGESWLPPNPINRLETENRKADGKVLTTGCNHQVSSGLSGKWHRDIFYQMKLGCECLLKSKALIEPYHFEKLDVLITRIQVILNPKDKINGMDKDKYLANNGGAMFLDALTLHDKETNRLYRTLQPSVNVVGFMVTQIFEGKSVE